MQVKHTQVTLPFPMWTLLKRLGQRVDRPIGVLIRYILRCAIEGRYEELKPLTALSQTIVQEMEKNN